LNLNDYPTQFLVIVSWMVSTFIIDPLVLEKFFKSVVSSLVYLIEYGKKSEQLMSLKILTFFAYDDGLKTNMNQQRSMIQAIINVYINKTVHTQFFDELDKLIVDECVQLDRVLNVDYFIRDSPPATSDNCVSISYHWNNYGTVVRIKDELESQGFQVTNQIFYFFNSFSVKVNYIFYRFLYILKKNLLFTLMGKYFFSFFVLVKFYQFLIIFNTG
jgi:hypothetical protein